MASALDLLHEPVSDLKDRARGREGVKVSLPKTELICELADKDLGTDARLVLDANKGDLVDLAEQKSIDTDEKSADDLREEILKTAVGLRRTASYEEENPFPAEGKKARLPDFERSHFEEPEVRWHEIEKAVVEAAKQSIREEVQYVVLESLRPQDESEPLKIQRAYSSHHPNEIIVWSGGPSPANWPIKTADGSPIARFQRGER
jgi:hypothetical protein